jgi:hypothetical protein
LVSTDLQPTDGHGDKPAEELVLYLTSGKAVALTGRFFTATGTPDPPSAGSEHILADDLLVLRLRGL